MNIETANARITIPADCLELVADLIKRLGGKIETDEEYITAPPMPENERPGRMLKGLRFREGLTQKDVALAIGVPQSHISEYEKGKRAIPHSKAKALADLLHSVESNFLATHDGD